MNLTPSDPSAAPISPPTPFTVAIGEPQNPRANNERTGHRSPLAGRSSATRPQLRDRSPIGTVGSISRSPTLADHDDAKANGSRGLVVEGQVDTERGGSRIPVLGGEVGTKPSYSPIPVLRHHRPPEGNVSRVPVYIEGPETGTGWIWCYSASRPGVVRDGQHLAKKRILKEMDNMKKDLPVGCTAVPKEDNLFVWNVSVKGPEDTVYQGGTFRMDIYIPVTYPFDPPKVNFVTPIYHCNINSQGVVCLDILGSKWKPTLTIAGVIQGIVSLMYVCDPEDPLVPSIASQYRENIAEFERVARTWTFRYAH